MVDDDNGLRITEIRVSGLRCLDEIRLPLERVTVLIGDNGSGKSTILEACELLRRLTSREFINEFHSVHGGMATVGTYGRHDFELGVRANGAEGELDYHIRFEDSGGRLEVAEESLDLCPAGEREAKTSIIRRDRSQSQVFNKENQALGNVRGREHVILLSSFGMSPPHHLIRSLSDALERIDVHLPFDVVAHWANRARGQDAELRQTTLVRPASRVERFGGNLTNAYGTLRNAAPSHWEETLEYLRLGLGYHVEGVQLVPDPGGGRQALHLKHRGIDRAIPAHNLSDGTLSYLAFVAMCRLSSLPEGRRSLIAFDEPDLHLHPELLGRVLGFFEEIADGCPVLLATHNDRLLDGLSEEAETVLVELDETMRTRLRRPDKASLARWLERFGGLGRVREEGYTRHVFADTDGVEP